MRFHRHAHIFIWLGFAIVFALPTLARKSASNTFLAPQPRAGKKLFLQTCSVCHLPPLNSGGEEKSKALAPLLNGFIKDKEAEARAREIILKGASGMPGYRYALDTKEVEALIAYLKTV